MKVTLLGITGILGATAAVVLMFLITTGLPGAALLHRTDKR